MINSENEYKLSWAINHRDRMFGRKTRIDNICQPKDLLDRIISDDESKICFVNYGIMFTCKKEKYVFDKQETDSNLYWSDKFKNLGFVSEIRLFKQRENVDKHLHLRHRYLTENNTAIFDKKNAFVEDILVPYILPTEENIIKMNANFEEKVRLFCGGQVDTRDLELIHPQHGVFTRFHKTISVDDIEIVGLYSQTHYSELWGRFRINYGIRVLINMNTSVIFG